MDCYKYKQFHSLSADKVLRQIEADEQMGWSLYLLQSIPCLLFGSSGGPVGLQAVMRRKIAAVPQAEE